MLATFDVDHTVRAVVVVTVDISHARSTGLG
jgi:hypothetical protein